MGGLIDTGAPRGKARPVRRAARACTLLCTALLLMGCGDADSAAREPRAATGIPGASKAVAADTIPFMRGITFAEWGRKGYEPERTRDALRRLRENGVDTVTLPVVWMQRGARSTGVRPGSETVLLDNVREAIRSARTEGLRVVLRPYIDRDDRGWRGDLRPKSVGRWFRSYSRFVLEFARLAQSEDVAGFVVGSELESLEGQERRWRTLVERVRGEYRGFVTYQVNWGSVARGSRNHRRWWAALDALSVSAYFELTKKRSYSADDLVAGWRRWIPRIEALRNRYDVPIFFGEVGYRSVAGSARRPWDTLSRGRPSPRAQVAGYEAVFRVWDAVPWFRGYNWWYTDGRVTAPAGARGGRDHIPTEEALSVLREWYAKPR